MPSASTFDGVSRCLSILRPPSPSVTIGTSNQVTILRQVELFFKWIKQHLRIKKLYGTSENAVKSQIWIAVSVYVLVAIVKKRLNLDASLYTLLQIFSLTLFEKMPIQQAFAGNDSFQNQDQNTNQLNLFAF